MKNCITLLFITVSFFLNLSPGDVFSQYHKNHDADTLKILTYNVHNCKGIDKIIDFQRTADVINRINADCVAIQELDSATQRQNQTVVLNELAIRTGMIPTFRASIDYQGGKYGIGILTREKPIKTDAIPLTGKEEKRSLLIVEMKNYVICCTHLSLTPEDRITSVRMIAEKLQKYSKPLFLAGDLNALPNSTEIKNLLNDFIIISNPSIPTAPADHPKICIDYILTKKSADQKVKVLASEAVNEHVTSDHLPVWVKVVLERK
jgi:endonuclease/exonuclease/phosphatase family metal-dependent hydrolase